MKKIYSYIGGMLLTTAMAFSITACSPDDFTSPNEAGIPVASTYEYDSNRCGSGNQLGNFYF